MVSRLIDEDLILSATEEWTKLEQEWGVPIDLDTEEDDAPHPLRPVFSSLDLVKSTFDSSFVIKNARKNGKRKMSTPILDYNKFLQDLEGEEIRELPLKQFYFISGQILSALSVEEICDKIDDIFKSVERLCAATSTIRHKKKKLPELVQCSISITDLSFDDTGNNACRVEDEEEKGDDDDVDKFIDEAFNQLSSTVASLSHEELDQSTNETVTTLVRKFSNVLNNPKVRSPRRKRQCCDRFKELAEFWQTKALEE